MTENISCCKAGSLGVISWEGDEYDKKKKRGIAGHECFVEKAVLMKILGEE